MALMRAKDVRGLEALLRVHGGKTKGLLQLAFRLPEGDHCLEDAVCDAGLELLKRARKLDPEQNLGGYFYITARRELVRHLKRHRAWHRPLPDDAVDHIPAAGGTTAGGVAHDGFIADEAVEVARPPLAAQVRQVIDGLSAMEREILTLDLANNFTLKASEVATILKTTQATVYSLRNRAKGKLQHLARGGSGDHVSV